MQALRGFESLPLRQPHKIQNIIRMHQVMCSAKCNLKISGNCVEVKAALKETLMTNVLLGGCHCGAIRYEAKGDAITHALCHCTDCRRHAGAPMVGWAMFLDGQIVITKGSTKTYKSSAHGRREFCCDCGTGLFYKNAEILPGIIDIQTATLDEPDKLPARSQIQVAERISWIAEAHKLPVFDRYPPHS